MRDLYEAVWERAPDDPEPWAFERRRALLLGTLRPGDRVLDLGCGAGRFSAVAAQAGAEVVGVDIAEAALERARRNAPGVRFERAMPSEDAAFDVVWCSEVLEHVPDTQAFLSEARRVLRSGGRLVVTTPAHGLVRRVAIALFAFERHFDPLGEHVRFYTRGSLRRVLEELGFDEVRVRARGAMLVAEAVRPPHVLAVA